MKNRFFRMTAMLLIIMFLSSLFCMSASADSDPNPSPAYRELMEMIVYAEQIFAVPENMWSYESYAIFMDKYNHAKDVLQDPASTDDDYIKAKEELQTGIDHLEKNEFYWALQNQLSSAERVLLPGNDWSDETLAVFNEKYKYAKDVLQDPSSTDEDYIKAADELEAAIDQLKRFNDKTELWNCIKWVDSSGLLKSAAKYTKTTYEKFEGAYTEAYRRACEYKIPQEEINAAVAALKAAVTGLVLIGDVNKDKAITVSDVIAVQKSLAGLEHLDSDAVDAADTDGNGVIEVNDCLHIQKYIAKIIQEF